MSLTLEQLDQYRPLAQKFVDFVNASPTAFHAVDTAKKMLNDAGFTCISEKEKWNLKPLGKYYYTRNQSTIVAFVVGGKFTPGNGINLIGAHTDSPHLTIKPNPELLREGYVQLEVEPYGGGLWTTWFDRDLSLAGRVIIKNQNKFETKLVRIERPLLRVPTLAIHLDRDSGNKLEFNKQAHLLPILCTAVKGAFEGENNTKVPVLQTILAKELQCSPSDICEMEIAVVDTQKSVIGGLFNEFIFSPRIDNLMMSFCSLMGIIESVTNIEKLQNEKRILGITLFDHEEVGSSSTHGAASPMVMEFVKRVSGSEDATLTALRNSYLISADMAHGVHPNYSDKHDPNHKPYMHKGVVIKENINQRYATNGPSGFLLKELARRNNVPFQDFVVRNDSLCGSTIGPIISANTGIRTVDIGTPQLSMHSIRETCAVSDVTHAVNLFKAFFHHFTELDETFVVD